MSDRLPRHRGGLLSAAMQRSVFLGYERNLVMAEERARLGPDDWLRAGFHALVEQGPDALKAEPLARALSTTKGSFYWHFKNLGDFHQQLQAHWKEAALGAIAAAQAESGTAAQNLQRLSDVLHPEDEAHGGVGLERAIRAWAVADTGLAAIVAEVDAARLAHVSEILAAVGLTNPDFPRLVYGAYLGMDELSGSPADNKGALSTLTAALLALQDA